MAQPRFQWILFDWGGTLMLEDGPEDVPISEIFCFMEIGERKESAQFWNTVISTLQASPRDLAMVGDSLEPDVIAPRRVGVFSVWFNQDNRQLVDPQGLPTIHRLRDLVPLLTSKV